MAKDFCHTLYIGALILNAIDISVHSGLSKLQPPSIGIGTEYAIIKIVDFNNRFYEVVSNYSSFHFVWYIQSSSFSKSRLEAIIHPVGGFHVAYPQAMERHWDFQEGTTSEKRRQRVNDLNYFDWLLKDVQTKRNIDVSCVFVTGHSCGPANDEIMKVLGQTETLKRIEKALKFVNHKLANAQR